MRFLREWKRWRVGGIVAALTASLAAALLTVEDARTADEAPKEKALPTDLAEIPSDALYAASVRIADLWSSDFVAPVREKYKNELDLVLNEFKKRYGLSPEQIERLTVVVLDPPPVGGESLFFARTVEAYDLAKILAIGKNLKVKMYKKQTIHVLADDEWALRPLDARSLVFGKYKEIRRSIDRTQPQKEGPLAGVLRLAAGKHTLVCGANVKAFNDAVGEKLPGEVEPFRPLLEARWGSAVVDLGKKSRLETTLHFAAEQDAKEASAPGKTGIILLRTGLNRILAQLEKDKDANDIVELLKQVREPLKAAQIEQQGATLRASVAVEIDPAKSGLMLVQMVQKMRAAAAAAQSANNLKQIGLAMHNYLATYNHFPPQAIYDKDGKPLLSWRVLLLPYIEQQNLYNRFHLDEPWDSEHNKKLLQSVVKVYTSPRQDEECVENHLTYYQGFAGKGAFFDGKKGLRIADFPDGLSNTLMIAEASKGVPWTKPEDISYDAEKPLPKLGLPGSSSYLVGICDGSVRALTPKLASRTLRLVITRNDGQPLGTDW